MGSHREHGESREGRNGVETSPRLASEIANLSSKIYPGTQNTKEYKK